MQWLRSCWAQREQRGHTRSAADAAQAAWLAHEEQRQLQEVRERLERTAYQLETTTRRANQGDIP